MPPIEINFEFIIETANGQNDLASRNLSYPFSKLLSQRPVAQGILT